MGIPSTLRAARRYIIDQLSGIYESQEAQSMANMMLIDRTEQNLAHILAHPQFSLESALLANLEYMLDELMSGRPIQYVLGYAEFLGRKFIVDESVLIPRPETEELVTWILEEYRDSKSSSSLRVLDIGTGTSSIITSIALGLSNSKCWGIDSSSAAIHTARKNVALHLADVELMQMDAAKISLRDFDNIPFDLIVSNPPYVTEQERSGMENKVLDFEPELALFAPEAKPEYFYELIMQKAKDGLLSRNGAIYFEMNEFRWNKLEALASSVGYTQRQLRKDVNGKKRMLRLCF